MKIISSYVVEETAEERAAREDKIKEFGEFIESLGAMITKISNGKYLFSIAVVQDVVENHGQIEVENFAVVGNMTPERNVALLNIVGHLASNSTPESSGMIEIN